MADNAAISEEINLAREMLRALEPLIESEGWQYYRQMLKRQEDQRRLSPPQATDGFGSLLQRDFLNGEISGLLVAQHLAETTCKAAKELLMEYDAENRDGKE